MKYCVSDIHGEYGLFKKLLQVIKFSASDEMYVCGDIVDKGKDSIKLAKFIASFPNVHCILGNHEYSFLKYFQSILQTSPTDFDQVLKDLQGYFEYDGGLLDWDLVEWFDQLPAYIEKEDFICVHAGIPLDANKNLLPLDKVRIEQLLNDRYFKEPTVVHNTPKCVFFGHTQTDYLCGESKILAYRRNNSFAARTVKDYYKIHLDTGAWSNGVLGCFCIDTLQAIYITE